MADKPDPFHIDKLDKEDLHALRALCNGVATEHQQRLCLSVIINKISRAHDLAYHPGSFDATAFMNGRAFVGKKLLMYLNIPIGDIGENPEDQSNVQK